VEYDASSWDKAVLLGENKAHNLYGSIGSINSDANWIWYINGGDFSDPSWGTVAYCRLDSSTHDAIKILHSTFFDLTLTGDNQIVEFYYDGIKVPAKPNFDDWTKTDTVSIPSTSSVLAVKLLNIAGSPAGFLASSSDGTILTDAHWRCINADQPIADWMAVEYDASSWDKAVLLGENKAHNLYGSIVSINSDANWIWYINGGDFSDPSWGTVAYCRLDLLTDG
jgi:hypothetical protein